jgi:S-adenosylmethionine/arginine decarboxylase-like enzyme
MSEFEIENKVAKSGLVVIEMDDFVSDNELIRIDIKDQLWEGIALKEKDFREYVASHDWNEYQGKAVAVFCSADAIIPNWAYMLLASKLQSVAAELYFDIPEEAEKRRIEKAISALDASEYEGARIIIKGCGKKAIHFSAYGKLTEKLMPVAKSIMFGEPCSTVPIFKRK